MALRENQTQRLDAVILILVLMAVGGFFWLVNHIQHGVSPQNCHMAGFANCTGDMPVITAPHRRDKLE